MEDSTPRQLYKQMAGGYATVVIDGGSITNVTINGEGWEYIAQDHGNFVGCVNRPVSYTHLTLPTIYSV